MQNINDFLMPHAEYVTYTKRATKLDASMSFLPEPTSMDLGELVWFEVLNYDLLPRPKGTGFPVLS